MAYYLSVGNGGTDQEILLGSPTPDLSTGQPFRLLFECRYTSTGSNEIKLIREQVTVEANWTTLTDSVLYTTLIGSGQGTLNLTHGVDYTDFHVYEIVYDGIDLWLEVDGLETDRITNVTGYRASFDAIRPDSITGSVDIKRVEFFYSGAVQNKYNKQSLNGSNDTVFPDTAGGNDGTLVNFPTDNSQWVFYSEPRDSVILDSTFSLNNLSVSSNVSVTVPQPELIGGFNLNKILVTSNLLNTLPQPIANGAFSIASPSFSASANASLPQPIADVAFTLNAPVFNASASASAPSGNLYYLQFDGVDDYVEASISTLTQPFSVEIDILINSGTGLDSRFFSISNQNNEYIGVGVRDGQWKIYSHGVTPGQAGTVFFGERYKLKLAVTGEDASLSVNGVLVYSVTPTQAGFLSNLNRAIFGGSPDGFNSKIDFYGATIKESGVAVNNYDPSASSGTGQILPDTVGSNDGTLVNFPTDDSQWIQYASAAPIADANFTLNKNQIIGDINNSLPNPVINSNFNLNQYNIIGNIDNNLPQPNITALFNLNKYDVIGNVDNELPNYSINGSFNLNKKITTGNLYNTLPQPKITSGFNLNNLNVSGDILISKPTFNINGNFNLDKFIFTSNITATLPQPEIESSFSLNNLITECIVSATRPIFNIDVSFNLSKPLFSSDATITLPQPSIMANVELNRLSFSGLLGQSGIVIIAGRDARITLSPESNRITL
ncbi:hypothetical protein [Haliea sp.]|nr:hypothetical protein [Haliea sp.]